MGAQNVIDARTLGRPEYFDSRVLVSGSGDSLLL